MNTQERIYLDYNATAPLAPSVVNWLQQGIFLDANPSSVHTSGKKARRDLERSKEYLFEKFGFNKNDYKVICHSGATEGINTIISGHASAKNKIHFIYNETDHSCIHNLAPSLKILGHKVSTFVDRDRAKLKEILEEATRSSEEVLLNWTWVNNETGLVFPLKELELLQQDYRFKVHVDAVQAVGKIQDWHLLLKSVDAYTFSGHKFGAIKGSGFSFIKNDFAIEPLLKGGGQQYGLRSGTENTFSFHSIPLALDYLFEHYNYDEQVAAKEDFEKKLIEMLGDQGEVVDCCDEDRNGNTIYFILYETKAQISSMAFDMAGFDVSNGSACSSGSVKPSRVLQAKGFSDKLAKSAIRISFSPYLNREGGEMIWHRFEKVLVRFISKN